MSCSFPLAELTPSLKEKILTTAVFLPPHSIYADDPPPEKYYRVIDATVRLPMGLRVTSSYPGEAWEYPSRESMKYTGTLLTTSTDPHGFRDQEVMARSALAQLHRFKVALLAMSTGYGKTNLGIWLSCALGRRTLIICSLSTVLEQWPVEFARFSTARCVVMGTKPCLPDEADVIAVGIIRAGNLLDADPHFFSSFGTVIVDECHLSSRAAFNLLLRLSPEYLIGLSATPDRADGLHAIFPLFFGPSEDFLVRKQVKSFQVIKVPTKCRPVIAYTQVKGKMVLDWTTAINSLSEREDRQEQIVSLAVAHHRERRTLILSGRVEEVRTLAAKIAARGLDVDTLYGEKERYRPGVMVLVATRQKAGVGFNDPGLNQMILATDIKDVRQIEGRCRTSDNRIFDLVDDYGTFEKHWSIRRKWYLARGAEIVEGCCPVEKSALAIPPRRLLTSRG